MRRHFKLACNLHLAIGGASRAPNSLCAQAAAAARGVYVCAHPPQRYHIASALSNYFYAVEECDEQAAN